MTSHTIDPVPDAAAGPETRLPRATPGALAGGAGGTPPGSGPAASAATGPSPAAGPSTTGPSAAAGPIPATRPSGAACPSAPAGPSPASGPSPGARPSPAAGPSAAAEAGTTTDRGAAGPGRGAGDRPVPVRERSGTRRTIRRARRARPGTGEPAGAAVPGTGRAPLGDDSGMSTVEYAIGTVAAAAFAAILYAVVSGDTILGALTGIVQRALSTTF